MRADVFESEKAAAFSLSAHAMRFGNYNLRENIVEFRVKRIQ